MNRIALGLMIYFGYGWWNSKEAAGSGEFDPLIENSTPATDKLETEMPKADPSFVEEENSQHLTE